MSRRDVKTLTGDQLDHVRRRIESWRRARGITQRELATRAGVSLSAIQALEAGTRRAVRYSSLRKIAAGMQCTIDELLSDAPLGVIHHDPRVAGLMPEDVEFAIMYQRAPTNVRIMIRDQLLAYYAALPEPYRDALTASGLLPGSYFKKVS